jgi:hypothetical protein
MARKKKNSGGRPALGPGRGRDGAQLRARVTQAEKDAVTLYCTRHDVTESDLLRSLLERLGVLKPRPAFNIDPELRHPWGDE